MIKPKKKRIKNTIWEVYFFPCWYEYRNLLKTYYCRIWNVCILCFRITYQILLCIAFKIIYNKMILDIIQVTLFGKHILNGKQQMEVADGKNMINSSKFLDEKSMMLVSNSRMDLDQSDYVSLDMTRRRPVPNNGCPIQA